ncbi:MAG: DUF501 domain-containing protein [Actinobacteria bacterium]|nr:DUF501 domain-containing protein [Actinomycetota bacterium]
MSDPDRDAVVRLLGREPRGRYEVVLRDQSGGPIVLRNAPLLDDGTPMPTLFWLVGDRERLLVSRLESAGGVRRASAEVPLARISAAHEAYATERDAYLPADHAGPTPFGGVGGTRKGIKCLHAHYAYWLIGGLDPVGEWVAARLGDHDNVDKATLHSGGSDAK